MTSVLMGQDSASRYPDAAAAGQDLVTAFLHPDAAAAGALQSNDRGSENLLFSHK